jgi:hypothetical protein
LSNIEKVDSFTIKANLIRNNGNYSKNVYFSYQGYGDVPYDKPKIIFPVKATFGLINGSMLQLDGPSQKAWQFVVYGIALLIYAAVDYYCDQKVANEVAACVGQRKCPRVNSCGADCFTCPP